MAEEPLTGFEEDIAVSAITIDTLWGGDHTDQTGVNHVIVDAWCSGKPEPVIANEELARKFLAEGIGVEDAGKVAEFIDDNRVDERLANVRDYADGLEDRWRRESIRHHADVLGIHLELRRNMVEFGRPIYDEEAYQAAFGRPPALIDSTGARETLRRRLEQVGFPVRADGSLTDAADAWTRKSLVDADKMEAQWGPMSRRMYELTAERIFPFLPDWVREIPADNVEFGIIRDPEVHYSGVNLAMHGVKDGKPVYRTILRVSDKVTRAEPDFRLGLVAHENMPGHGLHLPLMHGLFARGEYGFETTMMILCSPLSTLAEGVATSTTNLLFGPSLEEHLTPDELVAVALNDLNVAGRNNVVVNYIQGQKDRAELANFLRTQHCFPEGDAQKYTGWLFNPKMGKLLGLMYLPSYGVGREVVREAIEEHGREAVIPVVYGTRGQVDIINFRDRLDETVGAAA